MKSSKARHEGLDPLRHFVLPLKIDDKKYLISLRMKNVCIETDCHISYMYM